MTKDQPTPYNILFVCTGNTCRSPMAEVIARQALAKRGWRHVEVDSAGTSAAWDVPASPGALQAVADVGLDLSTHRSQPLTAKLVAKADIILVMTPNHVDAVEALGEGTKVSLISEFMEGPDAGQPIDDPVAGPFEKYVEARDRIARAVDGLLNRLAAILSP